MGNKEKLLNAILIFSIYVAAYAFTNHIALYPATLAPQSSYDQYFGFSPHWIWIYLGTFFYVTIGYALMKEETQIKNFVYAFLLLTMVANLIFLFRPTYIQRDLFPTPGPTGTLLNFAFVTLRTLDTERNCFPSLHVGTSFLVAFYLGRGSRKWGALAFLYSLLVVLSTFYTKQHNLWDATSGFLLSLSCYLIVEKVNPRIIQMKNQYAEKTKGGGPDS